MLDRYYNLFDPAKHYTELLFRAGDGLQSRELNEIQSTLAHRLKGVADAVLKDGDLVSGGEIVIEADGVCRFAPSKIYLAGAVRDVPERTLTIPMTGRVTLGVRLLVTVVTELEDPTLRDPAVGVRNYQEPGAGRKQETCAWGFVADSGSDGGAGDFYAVSTVIDGVLQNKERPPAFDGVTQLLARYDFEANGHYIVNGFTTRFLERRSSDGKLAFLLSAGTANVNGFKVERTADERLVWDWNPDLARVTAEPHAFNPDAQGKLRINLNRSPLDAVLRVQGTYRKTVTVTHGVFTGATDTLPDTAVVQVIEVKQGTTTYQAGPDYTVQGNAIHWSPAGAEPAPGSSYSVTYDHIAAVAPTAVDENGFTVAGLVTGTLVQVDYDWRMPRIDTLALSRHGVVERILGVAAERGPSAPAVPADRLRLADVAFDWRADAPCRVIASGVRTIKTSDIQAMQGDIGRLFDLVASDRLTQDIALREPSAKKGVFVDPFRSDAMRDMGLAQDAVCVAGHLMAPITAVPLGPYVSSIETLPATTRIVLAQTARTGSMKINPYAAVLPVPAAVTLTPNVDFWQEVQTVQAAAVTETFVWGSGALSSASTARTTETVGRTEQALPSLRPITVAVRALGFGPNEAVSAMRFDGVGLAVPSNLGASAAGIVTTSFTIPANIPAGIKAFEIEGAGGSRGTANFEGRGILVTVTQRERIRTDISRWDPPPPPPPAVWWGWDPLAQTFTLPESQQVSAVELWFTVPGTKPVTVQIRETIAGVPGRTVLAEGRINANEIRASGATRITLSAPVWLPAGVEYALVVLTDDTETACAIAELGKWDAGNQRWVTSQPYQVGVLLSSSNASTWTAHQDKDLTFRLLGVATTAATRSITLATDVQVTHATDLMVLGAADTPVTGTTVIARITLEDGRVLRAPVGATVTLEARFTGKLGLALELSGTDNATPVVHPGWQLLVGTLANTASYISRAIPAATSFNARVIAEVLAPGTSSVTASLERQTAGQYQAATLHSASPVGDGWVEIEWRATSLAGIGSDKTTRVKLDINNNPAQRARVRNLRVIVT